jgi:hypothetical protein
MSRQQSANTAEQIPYLVLTAFSTAAFLAMNRACLRRAREVDKSAGPGRKGLQQGSLRDQAQ